MSTRTDRNIGIFLVKRAQTTLQIGLQSCVMNKTTRLEGRQAMAVVESPAERPAERPARYSQQVTAPTTRTKREIAMISPLIGDSDEPLEDPDPPAVQDMWLALAQERVLQDQIRARAQLQAQRRAQAQAQGRNRGPRHARNGYCGPCRGNCRVQNRRRSR